MPSMPPEFTVRFKGGPLGGEQRRMRRSDFVGGRMRVPTIVPMGWGVVCRPEDESFPSVPAAPAYMVEEYTLEPWNTQYGDRICGVYETIYTASWVNPNESLQRENVKLRKELEYAKDVLDAINAVKKVLGI